MNDSYIKTGPGGTLISGPDGIRLFRAATVRSGLGLLKVGIRPAQGWTITKALNFTTALTGKRYKRTEIDKAMADLTVWIELMKSAIPTERT